MEEEPMGINLHFDDADWQRIERDYPELRLTATKEMMV